MPGVAWTKRSCALSGVLRKTPPYMRWQPIVHPNGDETLCPQPLAMLNSLDVQQSPGDQGKGPQRAPAIQGAAAGRRPAPGATDGPGRWPFRISRADVNLAEAAAIVTDPQVTTVCRPGGPGGGRFPRPVRSR